MANTKNDEMTSYLDWSDKGKASLWRYLLGCLLSGFVFFVLAGLVMFPFVFLVPDYKESLTLSVLATLMAFIIPFFAIPFIVKWLHQRPYWSVAMPRPGFEKWHFVTAIGVYFVTGAAAALLFSLTGIMPITTNPDFDWTVFVPVALIGTVGIFIQAGSEEILFRGYITQFIRRFTADPFVFIGIPSLLFALPHIANISKLGGSLWVALPYLISGVLYGWAAYRTGSLWAAVGVHWSNNYTSLVFIGTQGDLLPSAAPLEIAVPSLPVVTLLITVQSLSIYFALSNLLKRREARG